jgi:ABC-type transport system substrate-binding protein
MRRAGLALLALLPAACDNSPYPRKDEGRNVLYTSFSSELQHMDPGRSYSAGDYGIICNVLEPPFEYHYLKRPYELIPCTAREVPKPRRREVSFRGRTYAEAVVYTIRIKQGLRYHDHPCFVDRNRRLTEKDMRGVREVWDIRPHATREVKAADFVHAIRRLADSRVSCPLYPTFAKHFLGMAEYRQVLEGKLAKAREDRKAAAGPLYNRQQDERYDPIPIDYAQGADEFPFVREIDDHTFEIVIEAPYPPILYWMGLPFFAPVPPEAVEFFNQRPLLERSIELDKNLLGTGPYVLRRYDPTNEIVLERNPHFREERYPDLPRPSPRDAEAVAWYRQMKAGGMLEDVGKRLPQIDRIVYRMEKESIPRWNKFLQGYYDDSGIRSDMFDQAVQLSSRGESVLTDGLAAEGIRLLTSPGAGFYFYNFNMTDPVVGGYTDEKRKLRQAVSIAFDTEEEIAIFANGQSVASHGPIPPEIFGHEPGKAGMNPVVYRWDEAGKRPVRRSLDEARKLLAEAGYPNGYGRDGRPLVLKFLTGWSSPEGRSQVQFVRKQFQKLNIRLEVETSDANRLNEKRLSGSFQFLHWGWHGDYPDPENFLFLFYCPDPNDPEGEPVSKYNSEEFNRLFRRLRSMENCPERLAVIRQALAVVRRDAPAIFKSHPVSYALFHDWYRSVWPNAMALNAGKYHRIDPARRGAYRRQHNEPRWWPLGVLAAAMVLLAAPAVRVARRRLRET